MHQGYAIGGMGLCIRVIYRRNWVMHQGYASGLCIRVI